jgi:GxxExxY protein
MNTDRNRPNESGTDNPESYPEQDLTEKVLASAFAVHNALGAGFLERVYSNALAVELRARGVALQREVPFKIQYRNTLVGEYVADLIADGRVLVELKAARHSTQYTPPRY